MYYPSDIEIANADKILFNYCQKLTKCNVVESEELRQNTWVNALNALEKGMYHPNTSKFSSWLCRIAHNKMIDGARRKKPLDYYGEIPENMHPIQSNFTEIDAQSKLLLYTEIGRLPKPQQEMLQKTYWQNLKRREIAAEVGLDINNVASTIYRGQQNLKRALSRKRCYFNL
jgi:RNA polymerase sigma factor (sigma-70 family)